MSRARGVLRMSIVAAAAVSAIAACGGGSEGTVVAKAQADDYACHAGGAVAAPASVPFLRACADPTCWQVTLRDRDGVTSRFCVSREDYDRTVVGAFWHGRTDQ